MMLHGSQAQSPASAATATATTTTVAAQDWDQQQRVRQSPGRKRKAETQDNERLSKRLSLLNLGTSLSGSRAPGQSSLLADSMRQTNRTKWLQALRAR
jgi:hypothetical protein